MGLVEAALPYHEKSPSVPEKGRSNGIILRAVGRNLTGPEFLPRFRDRGAAFMPVPEAAMDLNDRAPAREHDVRFAGEVAGMEPKAPPPRWRNAQWMVNSSAVSLPRIRAMFSDRDIATGDSLSEQLFPFI